MATTEENLNEAFTGESEANRKYLAFAQKAEKDGFRAADVEEASGADVVCVLVPDDVIPHLPLTRPDSALTIVASGYTLAFERFRPAGDLGMVAPRMLGPEVRRCYEEGAGFITAVGVEHDATGRALARTLAVARAIGGTGPSGNDFFGFAS